MLGGSFPPCIFFQRRRATDLCPMDWSIVRSFVRSDSTFCMKEMSRSPGTFLPVR